MVLIDLMNPWIQDWMHCITENTQEFQIIQKVLLANKIDLSPETHRISREEGEQLAQKHRIDFFEVSAKEGHGIDDAFMRLTELVVEAQKNNQVSERKARALTWAHV